MGEWYDIRFKRCFENILGQAIPSVAWQQACLPASSGGLGLMTDALEVNGGTCHKSDLAFLIACRATRPAVDALLRSERVFVPLGYETARDELTPHLPNYAVALQECNGPIAQKEILSSLFEAARRYLMSQVCLGGAAGYNLVRDRGPRLGSALNPVRLLILVSPMLHSLMLFLYDLDCRYSRPNKRVLGVPRCWMSIRIIPSRAPWRGERSDCTTKSVILSSDICQMRRLGLVLNQKVSCQRNKGVDRLMFCLCRLLCVDNPNGFYIRI